MSELPRRLLLAVAAGLALTAAFVLARRPTVAPRELRRAENFRLLDQLGKSHELYGLADAKAVVIVSQGNGCPLVRQRAPALHELRSVYAPLGVEFLLINGSPQDAPDEIAREARDYGFESPILRDESQAVLRSLSIVRTAEAVVIDPRTWSVVYQGAIDDGFGYEGRRVGATRRYLHDALDALLAGSEIETNRTQSLGCLINMRRPATPTYTGTAAAILQRGCVRCHGAQGVPPIMTSYEEVRGWAPMIRETLLTHRMPPSSVDPRHGRFLDELSLSDREFAALIDWVEGGAPRGKGLDLLANAPRTETWGGSRLVFAAEHAQTIPADGVESLRVVPLTPRAPRDLWIIGTDVTIDRTVTHHVQLLALPDELPRSIGEENGLVMDSRRILSAGPLRWRRRTPAGTALFVPKGTRLGLSVHYTPSGREVVDAPRLVTYLHAGRDRPEKLRHLVVSNTDFVIPPRAVDFEVQAEVVLAEDIDVVGLSPHMHNRGAWMRFEVVHPDGRREVLLSVPYFVRRSQRFYELSAPKSLRAGARLVVRGGFDNSARNPVNPAPQKPGKAGVRSSDEMLLGHVYWVKPPFRKVAAQ